MRDPAVGFRPQTSGIWTCMKTPGVAHVQLLHSAVNEQHQRLGQLHNLHQGSQN